MPPKPIYALLACAGLALLTAGSLPAQDIGNPSGFEEKTDQKTKIERKHPSMFHRPEKATPSEQLAYAASLAREGRPRAARKQYNALVHEWHGSAEAPAAQESYARLLMEREDYADAFDEFQYLFEYFAGSFKHDAILDAQFKLANAVRTERHAKFLFFGGVTAPERALPMFTQIVRNAPQWDRAPEAQLMVGAIHEEQKDYALAATAYETVQLRYPSSPAAEEAAFARARCLYRLAKASPRDEEATRNVIAAVSVYLRDYPSAPNVAEARRYFSEMKDHLADLYYERAVFYDEAARRPESAIIAYRDFINHFPSSDRRRTAEGRIKALQQQLEQPNEN